MLVEPWTNEPYGFPLYNATKHGNRSVAELEMNMERAARRVANGESVYIPCTIAHTNMLNELLREELKRKREGGLSNIAREGVVGGGAAVEPRPTEGAERARELARAAVLEGENRRRELKAEKDKGLQGLEAPRKKGTGKEDEDRLAKMRQQLGLFE